MSVYTTGQYLEFQGVPRPKRAEKASDETADDEIDPLDDAMSMEDI